MTERTIELLLTILEDNNIDPETIIGDGEQTAIDILEVAVAAAIDKIDKENLTHCLKNMKTFTIPVTYMTSGLYRVEAETIAEAKEKVLSAEKPYDCLPKGADYMDDSMKIDEDMLREMNPDEFPDEE